MIAKVRKPTQEKINERNRREKLYEYYGIPYNVFDSEEDKEIVIYWAKAATMIIKGKEIPKDLESILLRYKNRRK